MRTDEYSLSLLCDFYELTMSQGYFASGYADRITYFDLFFRPGKEQECTQKKCTYYDFHTFLLFRFFISGTTVPIFKRKI